MIKKVAIACTLLFLQCSIAFCQDALITNIPARKTISLNGQWHYIVDPYETGFYDYRFKERKEDDAEAYWNTDVPKNLLDRKEHGYIEKYNLQVPGDWNSQAEKFLYYEGTVWYNRSFNYVKKSGTTVSLYFAAVNYKADVYLNGKKLGSHKGGFTPFNFTIPNTLLKEKDNFLVVKVDTKRYADEIPTLNTDWWNYGGITRNVELVELPAINAIEDYLVQLDRSTALSSQVKGWIKLRGNMVGEKINISIPALQLQKTFTITGEVTPVNFSLPPFKRWFPDQPTCYNVIISTNTDKVEEKIGFRTITTNAKQILVNGSPVFLRGISMHEEIPQQGRRAYSKEDAAQLLGWAKELGCNMVRLAHYPHDETVTRLADSLGILVWSEIPVYWTIDFTSQAVLAKATQQLTEMVTRDHNRASVIIWSVGNETPVSEARTHFMQTLITAARKLDGTRLLSAALEVNYSSAENTRSVDDPLGQFVDVVAFNEYLGWYGGSPQNCRTARWTTKYNKPLYISETGAEALGGYHADSATLWSEEFQEWYYKEQVAMLKRMPDNFSGISPWILADFRSPRRNNPFYQEGWNNKGLIDHKGNKKKAFFILQEYYRTMALKYR